MGSLPTQRTRINAATPGRITEYSRGRKYLWIIWSLSTKGCKNRSRFRRLYKPINLFSLKCECKLSSQSTYQNNDPYCVIGEKQQTKANKAHTNNLISSSSLKRNPKEPQVRHCKQTHHPNSQDFQLSTNV